MVNDRDVYIKLSITIYLWSFDSIHPSNVV